MSMIFPRLGIYGCPSPAYSAEAAPAAKDGKRQTRTWLGRASSTGEAVLLSRPQRGLHRGSARRIVCRGVLELHGEDGVETCCPS